MTADAADDTRRFTVARIDDPRRLEPVASRPRPAMAELRGADGGPMPGRSRPPFTAVLRRVLEAAWRRRLLIVLPLLLMVPIGLAAAVFMPRVYVARTLLLLQEGGRDNPLARTDVAPDRIQERFAGLDALLKSEQVLQRVLADLPPPAEPPTPRRQAQRLRDLQAALSMDLIGTDFLEIRLRGDTAEGLGAALESVTSRFLEALVAGEQGVSASRFLIERKAVERDAAERARAVAADRLAEARSSGSAAAPRLAARLAEAERQLAAAEAELAVYRKRYARAEPPRSVGILNAPERIVVFDPPRDPQFALSSRLLILASALGAGLMIGLGLAFAAETFSPRVREPEDLSTLTGLPVLATLPAFSPRVRSPVRRRRWGRRLLAVALVLAAAAAGYRLATAPPGEFGKVAAALQGTVTDWTARVGAVVDHWTRRDGEGGP